MNVGSTPMEMVPLVEGHRVTGDHQTEAACRRHAEIALADIEGDFPGLALSVERTGTRVQCPSYGFSPCGDEA